MAWLVLVLVLVRLIDWCMRYVRSVIFWGRSSSFILIQTIFVWDRTSNEPDLAAKRSFVHLRRDAGQHLLLQLFFKDAWGC